jgi:ankyrin repeat protein
LHYAARGGHKSVAEVLLAHNAEVDARFRQDWTPLFYGQTDTFYAVKN